jgi:hypothetical protein
MPDHRTRRTGPAWSGRALVRVAVIAGVLVMSVAPASAGSPWRQGGYNARNIGENLREREITAGNVGGLEIAWTKPLRGHSSFVHTAIVGGRVYVTGAVCVAGCADMLWVLSARTGAVLWRARVDDAHGTLGPPSVVDGRIVVASGGPVSTVLDGTVHVFPTRCADDHCGPIWSSSIWSTSTDDQDPPTPIVKNGWVYVGGGQGGLRAYPLDGCDQSVCDPAWIGPTDNALTPSIDHGEVLVAGFNADAEHREWLEAYPVGGCDASVCSSLWRHHTEPGGTPFLGWSDVSNRAGTAFVQFSQSLEALDLDACRAEACTSWRGVTDVNHTGGLAVGADAAFVANERLTAFPVGGCGAPTCAPAWSGPVSGAADVSIANGLVYVAAYDSVSIFDEAGCGASQCAPIVPSIELPDGFAIGSHPVIGEGMVLLSGQGIVALRLPAA